MSPDELDEVRRSWADVAGLRQPILAALARRLATDRPSRTDPMAHATWLFDAVEQLVGLLPAPSQLAIRARAIGETWPDPLTAPSFRVEGQAWLGAGRDCVASWTDQDDDAWRHAWLLLSDVLAAEALSPFTEPC